MISAAEALEKTKQIHLDKIESFIQNAIKGGKTECEIVPTQVYISEENIEIMEGLGYKVIKTETMAGPEIHISWNP